jgi:hypothetical protein
MSAPRVTIPMGVTVSMMLTLALPVLGPGCGTAVPEVDKAALYTPESLAAELAFRFRALSPDAKTATPKRRSQTDKNLDERLARAEQAKNKAGGGAVTKKKQAGPTTIDDLIADIDNKLELIKGTSRSDACRKMVDTISGDSSLSESDKKTLTELVGRLAEGL